MRGLSGVLVLLAVLLGAGGLGAGGHEWEELSLRRAPRGISAPDFTLPDLDGRSRSLAELRGKPVLLNFWASWCVPCEMEMPAMQRLHGLLGSMEVAAVAVNFREPADRVRAFARERGIQFPVLLDANGAVFARYRVVGLPFTVLIDAGGQVVAVADGPRNWDSAAAAALMERLRRGKD